MRLRDGGRRVIDLLYLLKKSLEKDKRLPRYDDVRYALLEDRFALLLIINAA